ncbi:MAG: hypothetical protein ACI4SY_06535 [Sutterella sp.]
MSYFDFSLQVLIQALLLANAGVLVSLLCRGRGSSGVRLAAKISEASLFGAAAVLAGIDLIAGLADPAIRRPLSSPFDLLMLQESLSGAWRVAAELALVCVLLVPVAVYLRKVLASQRRERLEIARLREENRSRREVIYEMTSGSRGRKLAAELRSLREGYVYLMSSPEVPSHVRDAVAAVIRSTEKAELRAGRPLKWKKDSGGRWD